MSRIPGLECEEGEPKLQRNFAIESLDDLAAGLVVKRRVSKIKGFAKKKTEGRDPRRSWRIAKAASGKDLLGRRRDHNRSPKMTEHMQRLRRDFANCQWAAVIDEVRETVGDLAFAPPFRHRP